MLSQSVENFVKAIYHLQCQSKSNWVSTNDMAKYLDHSAAAVTSMVKKLSIAESSLVEYRPYRGLQLTNAGRKVALEVIRHHRLIELYLAEALGVPWDKVHDEAEKLEHVISEDLEERMASVLGDPKFDPHGSPIPSKAGKVPKRKLTPLSHIEEGTTVEIKEVSDHDPVMLRYLGKLGLYPKAVLTICGREEFGDSVEVTLDNSTIHVGEQATPHILVTRISA